VTARPSTSDDACSNKDADFTDSSSCLRRCREAVAGAGNRLDVAGTMGVVPELPAQARQVARERVGSDIGGRCGLRPQPRDSSPRRRPSRRACTKGCARPAKAVAQPSANGRVDIEHRFQDRDPKQSPPIRPDSISWHLSQHRPVGPVRMTNSSFPSPRAVGSVRGPLEKRMPEARRKIRFDRRAKGREA
jgi:hypothetical protein